MFDNDSGDLPASYGYGGDPSTFAPDGYGANGPTSPAGINLQAGVGQYAAPFMDSAAESTPQRVHAQPPHRVDVQYAAPFTDSAAEYTPQRVHANGPHRVDMKYGVPFMDSAAEYTPSRVHANGPHRVDMQYGAASAVDTAIANAKKAPTVYSGSSESDINMLRGVLGLSKGGWDSALTDKLHAAQSAAGLMVSDVTSTDLWVFLFGGKQALDAYVSRKGLLDVGKSALEGLLSGAQQFVASRGATAPAAVGPEVTTAPSTPWTTYALYGAGGLAVIGVGYYGIKAMSKKSPATASNPKRKGKKHAQKGVFSKLTHMVRNPSKLMTKRNALIAVGVGAIGYGVYYMTRPAEGAATAPQGGDWTKTALIGAAIAAVAFVAYKATGMGSSESARERDIERFLLEGPR